MTKVTLQPIKEADVLFGVQRGVSQMRCGYRVAEKCTGESYATATVERVVKDASEVYGLYRG